MPDHPLMAPDEMLLPQVVELVSRSYKTVRRAVSCGELDHRYALGLRGRYLVFKRVDVERWAASRLGIVPAPVAATAGDASGDALDVLAAELYDVRLALQARRCDCEALARHLEALEQRAEHLEALVAQAKRLRP